MTGEPMGCPSAPRQARYLRQVLGLGQQTHAALPPPFTPIRDKSTPPRGPRTTLSQSHSTNAPNHRLQRIRPLRVLAVETTDVRWRGSCAEGPRWRSLELVAAGGRRLQRPGHAPRGFQRLQPGVEYAPVSVPSVPATVTDTVGHQDARIWLPGLRSRPGAASFPVSGFKVLL